MDWLNYHHLMYFWMVAKEGSVSRASEQLHLAQPTLSSQIKKLEKSLGVKLFDRVGRQMVLTETGQMVYRYAEEIFTLGRELTDALRDAEPRRLAVDSGGAGYAPQIGRLSLVEAGPGNGREAAPNVLRRQAERTADRFAHAPSGYCPGRFPLAADDAYPCVQSLAGRERRDRIWNRLRSPKSTARIPGRFARGHQCCCRRRTHPLAANARTMVRRHGTFAPPCSTSSKTLRCSRSSGSTARACSSPPRRSKPKSSAIWRSLARQNRRREGTLLRHLCRASAEAPRRRSDLKRRDEKQLPDASDQRERKTRGSTAQKPKLF